MHAPEIRAALLVLEAQGGDATLARHLVRVWWRTLQRHVRGAPGTRARLEVIGRALHNLMTPKFAWAYEPKIGAAREMYHV